MSRFKSESVEELYGSTPLVKLRSLPDKKHAAVYAKLDYFNPGRSVKDRIAFGMIRDAEKAGRLKKGRTIVEPSSGNTGISLALAGRIHGYRVLIVMPDSDCGSLKDTLLKMGAEVKLTAAEKGMRGARSAAIGLSMKKGKYFMPDQFRNSLNPEIHKKTTGKELVRAMGKNKVDAFVAGVGTGGTLTGVGEAIRARYPRAKIVAVEPAESPVLSGGKPGPHGINGIGAGFVPPLLNRNIIDDIIAVKTDAAERMSEKIAKKESLLAGVSSGAVMCAALKTASGMKNNQNVVAFFADSMAGV
ncbi:MAG: PLP-dependent cysteine synthase family protein [Nitrospinota bacterium]